jgi:hypothetical protein
MPYGQKILIPPSGEPVSVAEMHLQSRIEPPGAPVDTTQDLLIASYITSARQHVEAIAMRQFVSTQYLITFDRFPGLWSNTNGAWFNGYGNYWGYPWISQGAGQYDWTWVLDGSTFRFPGAPLQSVDQVQYIDGNGVLQTLDPSLYMVSTMKEPGLLSPSPNQLWPSTQPQYDAVKITFTAGYGPVTTASAPIPSGTQTVTVGTMLGIFPGTVLVVDVTPNDERVVVSSVTPTTFTATFVKNHSSAPAIRGDMPEMARSLIRWLAAHLYENREPITQGTMSAIPLGFESMVGELWTGEYQRTR